MMDLGNMFAIVMCLLSLIVGLTLITWGILDYFEEPEMDGMECPYQKPKARRKR